MPRPQKLPSPLMRPLVALAIPGMYLFYKYDQYRRQQQEVNKRKVAEKELAQLHHKIDKLLAKLEEHEPELATSQEDECVICISAKATMQTYPCAHRVVCRKCFVKTIQMAVSERVLPLRCVICRTKILRLKQGSSSTSTGTTTPSYCTGSRGGVSDTHSVSSHKTYPNPNSHQGTFVRAVKQQMKELSGKETTSNNKIIVSGRKGHEVCAFQSRIGHHQAIIPYRQGLRSMFEVRRVPKLTDFSALPLTEKRSNMASL